MPELWDLYDINLRKTGQQQKRGEAIAEGLFHIVVEIWTVNEEGKLLLTKRSPNKYPFPDMWECTGGSLIAGEEPLDGARRELFEETGIAADKNELIFLGRTDTKTATSSRIYYNYIVYKNIWVDDIVFQEGETCDARMVTADEFSKMCVDGIVSPSTIARYDCFKIEKKLKGN